MTHTIDTVMVCRGDTAYFVLDVQNGRPPYLITWFDGSNGPFYDDIPSDTTFYPFYVVDGCGIAFEDSMMAWVAPDPLASFSYLNDYSVPLRVQFTNRSVNAASWLWDFGNGQTSTDADPVWDFPKPGTYPVILSIVSEEGCVDQITLEVTVESDFYLYVPTAFTPDGDGLNECFEIQGVGFESFEIKIFNRWGNMVFASNNIEECWDGTVNGQPAPQGVYTYAIFLKLPFNKIHQREGMVMVYR
jgi:gliding motility-associated-like protein